MSADAIIWFSASQLALLGEAKVIPDMPRTERNAREFARRAAWQQRDIKGRGGVGGMRTEYQPPAAVLAMIQSYLAANPEFFKKKRGKAAEREPIQPDKYVMIPSAMECLAKERDAAAMLLDPNPEDRLRMLQMVLRMSEMQLTTPPPPDVAKKVIDLADAWSPFAAKFPDLKERLDTLKATASFFI